MDHQVPLDERARADTVADDGTHEVLADLAYQRLLVVNVVFGGMPGAAEGEWVLIDAGVVGSANAIRKAWKEGGSGAGIAAVTDELSNSLGFIGSVDECRDRLAEEEAAGINLHSAGVAGYDAMEEGKILEQLAK